MTEEAKDLTLASKMQSVVSICCMRRDMFESFCGERNVQKIYI